MKKVFYDEIIKCLIVIGFLEEIVGGVGVEVVDDFDVFLYVMQWDGKEFIFFLVLVNFIVVILEDFVVVEQCRCLYIIYSCQRVVIFFYWGYICQN